MVGSLGDMSLKKKFPDYPIPSHPSHPSHPSVKFKNFGVQKIAPQQCDFEIKKKVPRPSNPSYSSVIKKIGGGAWYPVAEVKRQHNDIPVGRLLFRIPFLKRPKPRFESSMTNARTGIRTHYLEKSTLIFIREITLKFLQGIPFKIEK